MLQADNTETSANTPYLQLSQLEKCSTTSAPALFLTVQLPASSWAYHVHIKQTIDLF